MKKLLFLLCLIPTIVLGQNSWFNLQIQYDFYAPSESSVLINGNGDTVLTHQPTQPYEYFQTIVYADSGDFTVTLFDSFGDGWIDFNQTDVWVKVSNQCQGSILNLDAAFNFTQFDTVINILPCPPPILGCTDTMATNYDPNAYLDNGSCSYIFGCTDPNAVNYDPNAAIELEGSVEISSCNSIWTQNYFGINLNFYNSNSSAFSTGDKINVGGIDYWIDAIVLPTNCNSNVALIYVANSPYAVDGLWTSVGGMLQNPVGPQDNWSIGGCYYNPGCTNPLYVEFDPNADFDDGSCQTLAVFGCTDSTAINFNPWADNDDGSCVLPPSCGFTEFECQVSLTLDNYPSETGWLVTADNGTSIDTVYYVSPGTYNYTQSGTIVNTNFCVPANLNTFITFTLTDSYGDGLAGTTTGGTVDGDVIVENISCGDTIFELASPSFGSSVSSDGTYSSPWPMLCNGLLIIPGCMDAQYQEYNPLATNDDGSCQTLHIYGCMDTTSFNYDSNATSPAYVTPAQYQVILEDDGGDGWGNSFIGLRQGNQLWDFKLDPGIFVDTFYIDLNVDVYQTPLEMFYFEIPLPQQNPSQLQIQTIQNSVVIKNDYGIIIEEGTYPWANGNKLKKFNGPQDIYTGIPFGGYDCIPKIYGCTDSTAHIDSYDPNANTDDGSCFYNPDCNNAGFVEFWEADSTVVDYWSIDYCYTTAIFGCTDSTMFNYSPSANVDNGSCIPYIYGCTDPSMFNYNSQANVDDSSCVPYIYGCTDPTMFNYNSNANVDDGTCIPYVYGCTDSTMWNYDPLANTDNGSCEPFIYGCMDPNAFNYNPLANTNQVSVNDFSNPCIPIIYGCTDSTAFNYDPNANTDDGSCIITVLGCTDINAYNYLPTANTDDGSCLYDAGCIGGPGVPYWLNDSCYAWVISVDPYCCDNIWDSFCQAEYNFCQDGTPLNLDNIPQDERKIIVYPNPTQETINIKHNLNDDVMIEIRDMMGKLILTSTNQSKINVSGLSTGLYNLTIKSNQIIVTKRIIKQ